MSKLSDEDRAIARKFLEEDNGILPAVKMEMLLTFLDPLTDEDIANISAMDYKFKVGDKVKVHGKHNGIVKTLTEISGVPSYWVQYDDESFLWNSSECVFESQVETILPSTPRKSRCECGARKFSSFPSIHSFWCPEFGE